MAPSPHTQNYANHPHTPRLTRYGFLCVLVSAVAFGLRWFGIGGRAAMATGLGAMLVAVLILLLISRAYTTALQDRIIKLEMRLRTATLLTPAQQQMLADLSKKQIVALRFASDAELPALIERASREHLPPDAIKRAIVNWTPDWDRT